MSKNPKVNNRRGTPLNLIQSDPLKRLGELCKKGGYYYHMSWDVFSNGIMMECTLFHSRGRYILCKEVRFVKNPKNITEAKKVVSAILLDNMGLGMEDCEEDFSHEEEENLVFQTKFGPFAKESQKGGEKEKEEDVYEDAAKDVTRMGMSFMTNVLSEICQKNPELASAIPGDEAVRGLLKGLNNGEAVDENITNIFKLLTPSSGFDEKTVKDDLE